MVISSSRPAVQYEPLLVSLVAPYRRCTILTPVELATVHAQLFAQLDRLADNTPPGLLAYKVRYDSSLRENELFINGPIGARRLRLQTHGTLRAIPGGTALDLVLRVSETPLITTGLQALLLIIGMTFMRAPWGMMIFLLGFLYIAVMLLFRYEVSRIVEEILQATSAQRSFQTIAQSSTNTIVADGIGWRCSACGGYVRQDATFCKHCHCQFN